MALSLPFDVDHEPVNDVRVSREAKKEVGGNRVDGGIDFTKEWKNFW